MFAKEIGTTIGEELASMRQELRQVPDAQSEKRNTFDENQPVATAQFVRAEARNGSSRTRRRNARRRMIKTTAVYSRETLLKVRPQCFVPDDCCFANLIALVHVDGGSPSVGEPSLYKEHISEGEVCNPKDEYGDVCLAHIVADIISSNRLLFFDVDDLLEYGAASSWCIAVLYNIALDFRKFRAFKEHTKH